MLLEDGGGGNGRSKAWVYSLNNLSKPGLICLAMIGKLVSRSPKNLMSFFRGLSLDSELEAPFTSAGFLLAVPTGSTAGLMMTSLHVPISGFEM